MTLQLRDFEPQDAEAVNRIALAAFQQYKDLYADWPTMAASIGAMSSLARNGAEIILAETSGSLVGGVAYVPPGAPKARIFEPDWPVIRMLVVDPVQRGTGAGRALTNACIARARRDGATSIALHTSPIMEVALAMYLRMGFEKARDAPPIFGIAYGVYVKRLD